MKKRFFLLTTIIFLSSLTYSATVEESLNSIEAYLGSNEMVQDSAGLEKLKRDGQIKTVEKYKSLEREADAWSESQ